MNSKRSDNAGVVYLAFGYDYVIQTVRSTCSLKATHPELPVTIVTNIPLNRSIGRTVTFEGVEVGPELFDEVIYIDDDTDTNRQYKTSIDEYSPYDRTLFLDCDTVIKREITQGFNILDHADLAAVARPIPSRAMSERWDGDIHVAGVDIEDSSTFYGGVFFFNTATAAPFFDAWQRSFNEFGYEYDQYSFTHTIYATDIKVLPLPIIWNVMDSDVERYTGFDEGYNFQDQMKVHHQNYSTRRRDKLLRKLEAAVGDELLAVDDTQRTEIREKYGPDSQLDLLKTELGRSQTLRTIHSKVTKML